MKPKHIVVIGAGQLGSRHIQALALCEHEILISVVDPSIASLKIAKERFNETKGTRKSTVYSIDFYEKLEKVPNQIDLCIIATNANHRLAVLEQVLQTHELGFIVFEKVLFQSLAQLDRATQLLEQYDIKAWVNCPRRMFPSYKWLKEELAEHGTLTMKVTGNDWGMACNAIHFIDLWAFITASSQYTLDMSELDASILDSKRAGYKEVSGTLKGYQINGSELFLNCSIENNTPNIQVCFETDHAKVEIGETIGIISYFNKHTEVHKEYPYEVVYQSALTQVVADDLFREGGCELTTFNDSAILHRPFLQQLSEFFIQNDLLENGCCPIT